MKSSRPRQDLLLVLARTEQYGVAYLTAQICYRYDPTIAGRMSYAAPGDVLSPVFEHPDGTYDRYADLTARANVDTNGIGDGSSFGWRHEYRPHSVDRRRAESMTTFLRRLDRQLTALETQLGVPATFADYLAHFAAALGITRYAVPTTQLRPDGTRWISLDADGMRRWVSHHEPPQPIPWP
jgi:hypothetical protein